MSPRRRSSHSQPRPYARTARLNELIREIVAEELERIADEGLELVTIISVEVDPDLRRAAVYVDSPAGEAADADVLAALGEHRIRLQAAIARQARTKRTPELRFLPDDVERRAARVEDILRGLHGDYPLRGPLGPSDPLRGPLGPGDPLRGPLGPSDPLRGPLGPSEPE